MAVSGLSNMSVFNSSLSRESHQSPSSRWLGDSDRPSTPKYSILQMWRELEGEHISNRPPTRYGERPVKRRTDDVSAEFETTYLSREHGHYNSGSLVDTNEVENDCSISHQGMQSELDDGKRLSLESLQLGELETERVMKSGLRDHILNNLNLKNCSRSQWLDAEECERVQIVRDWVENTTQQRGRCHDGVEEKDAEIGYQIGRVREELVVGGCGTRARRTIRRLFGRQALLDLLMKAEWERKRELQELLEHRLVSDFPHRNRIQSLLKGRFLRNKSFIEEERHSSIAASELGLLGQRHTVSDLREGFLSESENFLRRPVGCSHYDTYSNDDTVGKEHAQANSLEEVVHNEYCDADNLELTYEETDIMSVDDSQTYQTECLSMQESSPQVEGGLEVLEYEDREQQSFSTELTREDVGTDILINGNRLQETSAVEGSGIGSQDSSRVETAVHRTSGDIGSLEGYTFEEPNMLVQSEGWQELFTETGEGIAMDSNYSSDQRYQLISDTGDEELTHLLELHDNTLTGAAEDSSDVISGLEVAAAERIDTSYLSDDCNGQSLELRELVSRRIVYNLLRSDFRYSLDQLIQSYVERQGHASVDWEMGTIAPFPAPVDQYEEHGDPHVGESDAVGSSLVLLPLPPQLIPSETTWEHEFYDTNWQQPNSLQHFRIELEIINDLRIDIARLHQRMTCMQTMLEACMDMQLELQRSVRQEVSAALNRPSGSEEECKDDFHLDESKWDHVRKGICCVCVDAGINSLLYRCGHMCTCSKCEDKLVIEKGKCPMCRAPVVQAVRAYSIQE